MDGSADRSAADPATSIEPDSVGVVIGTAFGKIVTSPVNHALLPTIRLVTPSGNGYQEWAIEPLKGQTILVGLLH